MLPQVSCRNLMTVSYHIPSLKSVKTGGEVVLPTSTFLSLERVGEMGLMTSGVRSDGNLKSDTARHSTSQHSTVCTVFE